MHEPVLLEEVIKLLEPRNGDVLVDGTANGGGHLEVLAQKIFPDGRLVGIEWDKELFKELEEKTKRSEYKSKIEIVNGNYKNLEMILKSRNIGHADKILLDLGFSSYHIDESGRGFSFRKDEPLRMTYSDEEKPASDWLNDISEADLADVITRFGEERYASEIAHAIKNSLPIKTAGELAEIITRTVPRKYERGRIHPATRTFQALRIFVNHELENLESFLGSLERILNSGGRAAIISFHSLEDRIVKQSFKSLSAGGAFRLVTKKAVSSTRAEALRNPRSRSAKLRVIEKI